MIRRIFFLVVLLALALSACQGAGPVTGSTVPTAPANLPPLPTVTATPSSAAAISPAAVVSPTATSVTSAADVPLGCTVVSTQPTPGPTQESLFPSVSSSDWTRGPADASVTIVEYADFQCPGCAQLEPVLEKLEEAYPKDLRVVFRHFPLESVHDKAAISSQAAEAAGIQGKFWEMHDLLYTRQGDWAAFTVDQFRDWVVARAGELGLNVDQFKSDMASQPVVDKIQQAWDHNKSIGMPGTPFLLINNQVYQGPLSFANLDAIVRVTLLQDRQFDTCPQMTIDPSKQYLATLKTAKGDIVLQLFPDKAPLAVNSFVFLARHGWFDGVTFHRVIPGFVAQAGDPSGTGYGGPGYAFKNEISPDLKFDQAGLLAMANAGPDTNGSQFFITLAATPNLDGKYTIFGKVISGMDVVNRLTPRDPSQSIALPPGDQILQVTIEEK
jgi:cyclophilin family peptidyl-prolyl cis-trans isomerase/protein-disulfide isomerase